LEELNERFVELAPFIFDYNYTVSEDRKKSVVAQIHEFYMQGRPVTLQTTKELIQVN
jgi:hypothetical protein